MIHIEELKTSCCDRQVKSLECLICKLTGKAKPASENMQTAVQCYLQSMKQAVEYAAFDWHRADYYECFCSSAKQSLQISIFSHCKGNKDIKNKILNNMLAKHAYARA